MVFALSNQLPSLVVVTTAGNDCCKPPSKTTEEEDEKEGTVSLAAAKETNVEVLFGLNRIFVLKEE